MPCCTDTEKRLTHRLEDGFSQVLSQLQALSAPAIANAPAQGAKRSEPMQTPHKGGPKKESRIES